MRSTDVIIETKGLTRRFSGIIAVNNVDLTVRKGETVGLVGPNGAGKTTLLNLIAGVLKPMSGKIFFEGRDITNLSVEKRAKLGIARSFQIPSVFLGLTVRENIKLATQACFKRRTSPFEKIDKKLIEKLTDEFLEMFNLTQKQNEKAENLTFIQQRILEAILALATNPKLVLLDEPTGGMSAEEIELFYALLRKFSTGKTFIIVEHNIEFLMRVVDKVVVLNEGKVIAEGTPKQISENEEVQRVYLGGGVE